MEIYERIYKKNNLITIYFQMLPSPIVLSVSFRVSKNEFYFMHHYKYDLLPYSLSNKFKKINWMELFAIPHFQNIDSILESCRQHCNSEIRKYRQSKIIKTRKKCFHIYQLKKARDILSKYI